MPGLRERKKQRTHDSIVRAAIDLFCERGYEATTVADIAGAADISPRTFFAYFETKEAVVFHDFDEFRERFAARMAAREPGETAFDALRGWVAEWLDNRGELSELDPARRRLIRSTPALWSREQANLVAFERLLAQSVAEDLGLPADSVRPRMVGAAAVAALSALEDFEATGGGDYEDTERAMAFVDEALAFTQGGLDELRRRPPVA